MGLIHLESLRAEGFKSFVDPVELAFGERVAAIIGPNGCGKSNLVDAILFVLGEQSPSLMRLKSMGDVVFSGSARRKPAGGAEVEMILSADDGRWAETGGRLHLKRRVFREGPSEYRINGKHARLKDVNDELMSIGLGTRDYAIIEQGRVAQVLTARPTERRALIEEAAGITRYKARRHDAELKLERSKANLLRLDDIIGEVKKNLRSIRRQARAAERYTAIEAELTVLRETLALQRGRALAAARSELAVRRRKAEDALAVAIAELGSAQAETEAARSELAGRRDELEAGRHGYADLRSERDRLETFLERSADLLESIDSRLERAHHESSAVAQGVEATAARRASAEAELAEMTATLERMQAARVKAQSAESSARTQRLEAEESARSLREELLAAIAALSTAHNQRAEIDRSRDRLSYALSQLENEKGRLASRRNELQQRLETALSAETTTRSELEAVESAHLASTKRRDELIEKGRMLRVEAEATSASTWECRHELRATLARLARIRAAVDALSERLPAGAVLGQVVDHLDPVGDGNRFDRAWAPWLELPVVDASALSEPVLAELAQAEGRVELALAGPVEEARQLIDTDLRSQAGFATDSHDWLTRVLPQTLQAGDENQARALADAEPDALILGPGARRRRGRVLETASGEAETGVLELRGQRDELEKRVVELERKTAEIEKARETTRRGRADTENELRSIEVQLVETRTRAAAARRELETVNKENERLDREARALEDEARRLQRDGQTLGSEAAALEERALNLSANHERVEAALDLATNSLEVHREAASDALRALDRHRADERLADERHKVAAERLASLAEERASLDRRRAQLSQEIDNAERGLKEAHAEITSSKGTLESTLKDLAAAELELKSRTIGVDVAAQRATAAEKAIVEARRLDAERRELRSAIELEGTRLDADWEHLIEDANVRLALDLPTALEATEIEEPSSADQRPHKERIADLEVKLEKIGPVNLLALSELDELVERDRFLDAQRADLDSAISSLGMTIAEIDEVSTERFIETFELVSGLFTETFSRLFGGGTATIELIDPEQPLTTGIDITAQPPGKRNQSVQLLSGGEKALTALSLLIALFRIKPAPFCILDEVDAPLDDANVVRLSELVQMMTEHTQFIFITHNRRTMARADLLYGVTMEEPGVSKLVSVRMEG